MGVGVIAEVTEAEVKGSGEVRPGGVFRMVITKAKTAAPEVHGWGLGNDLVQETGMT